MRALPDPTFLRWRDRVLAYPRSHGYYLLELAEWAVDLEDPVELEVGLERILEQFDDAPWPAADERPTDQGWLDYEVDEATAGEVVVEALVGGPEIGHLLPTIPEPTAQVLWRELRGFFGARCRFFTGLGLGRSEFVYQRGAAMADGRRVGLLWVVESD